MRQIERMLGTILVSEAEPGLVQVSGNEKVFRIMIMGFMDRCDIDIGSIKRSYAHIVEPDGKIYPLETWNLFRRRLNDP